MWNKIFKPKSSKSSSSSSSSHKNFKNGKIKNHEDEVLLMSDGGNYEFIGNNNCNNDNNCNESIPVPITVSTSKSKFSKVVNSFSLKRSSKGKNVTHETINSTTLPLPPSSSSSSSTVTNTIDSIKGKGFLKKDHDKMNELLVMDDNNDNDDGISTGVIDLELKPCPICTRTFVPDTLKKHVSICERMAQKKRKIFDSSRQRREGTDLANFLPKGFGLPENKKQCHYQQQYQKQSHHSNLDSSSQNQLQKKRSSSESEKQTSITALCPVKQNDNLQTSIKELPSVSASTSTTTLQQKRSSISNTGSTVSSASIPKVTTEPKQNRTVERKRNLLPPSEPCPYCERCFGIKAYDRHVEWCKEKTRLLANKKNTAKTPAKERLEARIRYRAPCVKSKRAANREKYSGLSCDDSISLIDGYSEKSGSSDPRKFGMSASLSSSIMSESRRKDTELTENLENSKTISHQSSMTSHKSFAKEREARSKDNNSTNHMYSTILDGILGERIRKDYENDIVTTKLDEMSSRVDNTYEKPMMKKRSNFHKNSNDLKLKCPITLENPLIQLANEIPTYKPVKRSNSVMKKRNFIKSNLIQNDFSQSPRIKEKFVELPKGRILHRTMSKSNVFPFFESKKSPILPRKIRSLQSVNEISLSKSSLNDSSKNYYSDGSDNCSLENTIDGNDDIKYQYWETNYKLNQSKSLMSFENCSDPIKNDYELFANQCNLPLYTDNSESNESDLPTSSRTFNIDKEISEENLNENGNENVENIRNFENMKCIETSDSFDDTFNLDYSKFNDDVDCLTTESPRNIQDISLANETINENQDNHFESINNWSLCKNDNTNESSRASAAFVIETDYLNNEENEEIDQDIEFDIEFNNNFNQIMEDLETKLKNEMLNNNNMNSNHENSENFSSSSFGIDEIFDRMIKNQVNDKMKKISSISDEQDNNVNETDDYLDSNSICSGMSDKYDPFLSAKRQLEELCSPTSTEPSITPTTPNTPNTPITKLSSSYTAATTPSSRATTNTNNTSNFRRTSSLRVSRKKTTPSYTHHHPSSRPLFCQSKERPTIQRGISDEGPISSSFLKPEEYDEMPVKSACVNDLAIGAHHHHHNSNSPKIIKRDINSSMNRRNLRLNINNKPINTTTNTNSNDKITSNVVGSSSSSSSLINPISKTDSLAIFLKYENETKNSSTVLDKKSSQSPSSSSTKLTEKDLKDKTNTNLSKNHTLSSSNGTPSNKLLPAINPIDCKMNFNTDNTNNNNRFKEISTVMTISKIHPIKLEPLPKNIISLNSINLQNENSNNNDNNQNSNMNNNSTQAKSLNLNSILVNTAKDSTDFIDPKLINVCDNLPINITKFSDSDMTSTSSTDSASTTKYTNLETISSIINTNQQINQFQQKHNQQQAQQHQQLSANNRNSSERRNLLKRQLRLGKNQFLYDMSPEDDDDCVVIDSYSDQLDKTISMIDTTADNDTDNRIIHRRNITSSQTNNNNNSEPPTFDDFDFEEFLSSFDANDEEQYPIFKDYKQFLLTNRSLNKQHLTPNQQLQQNHSNNNDNTNNSNNRSKREPTSKMHNNIDEDNEADGEDDGEEEEFCDNDDINLESRKNEIFISIETNQTSDENDGGMMVSPSSLLPLNNSLTQNYDNNSGSKKNNNNDNMDIMCKNSKIEMNKTEKSDNRTNFNDINRNKTKTFIELNEMDDVDDDNNENREQKEQKQQKQQQQHHHHYEQQQKQQKQSSDNNMMFQLQDSDEICSSIDENFSIQEHNNSLRSKQNADSAYGSLSRHSPIDPLLKRNSPRTRLQSAPASNKKSVNDQQAISPTLLHATKYTTVTWNENSNKHRNRNFSASSSGSSSDNSLPSSTSATQLMMGKDEKLQHQEHENEQLIPICKRTQSNELKMSKFCHECGSKFILTQAKFCMECGVKRIIIE